MSLDDLFGRLRESIHGPPDDDLRAIARRASAEQRVAVRPHHPARWAKLGVAAALVLANAAGFGLGSWLTPA